MGSTILSILGKLFVFRLESRIFEKFKAPQTFFVINNGENQPNTCKSTFNVIQTDYSVDSSAGRISFFMI